MAELNEETRHKQSKQKEQAIKTKRIRKNLQLRALATDAQRHIAAMDRHVGTEKGKRKAAVRGPSIVRARCRHPGAPLVR